MRTKRAVLLGSIMLPLLLAVIVPVAANEMSAGTGPTPPPIRFATFNASLNRTTEGELIADLSTPDDSQAATVAEIIQRVRPDVLLVNEFDFDTADFSDVDPGNLRVDYVLPRKGMRIVDAAVFWPTTDDPLFELVGIFPFPSSDHRLVWADIRIPGD